MTKRLPPIFKMEHQTLQTNNMNYTYLQEETPKEEIFIPKPTNQEQIRTTIDKIFATKGYVFNILVEITTKENKITTTLATKTPDALITMDNQIIPIDSILNIKIKDPIK